MNEEEITMSQPEITEDLASGATPVQVAVTVPRQRRVLGKHGTIVREPGYDDTKYVADDSYGFLARGRDFEPMNITHKYTDQEKEALATYESLDYLPSHSEIYKTWIRRQKISVYQFDIWVMMGLIGFATGLIGFLLHQLIEKIADVKWDITQKYLESGDFTMACVFAVGYSVAFILFSAGIVIYLRPCAGGSGIPEITGFLNGTNVRHIFNIKTMVVKFLSCVSCVGCGLPVGPEGPMIHLGALVGAGLSQFKSETLRIKFPVFERFRTSEARRNFISAGAAAGVASAFGAPVGGLLFSMEEVCSFWTVTLSWQIFFCCIVATFTTDLFNSAFTDFEYTGSFGAFKTSRYILFEIDSGVDVNLLMFIPTAVIGIIGGMLGALFTILNLKMTRLRKKLLSQIGKEWIQKLIRLLEPALIMIIVTVFSICIPAAFSCTQFTCVEGKTGPASEGCWNDTRNPLHVEKMVKRYTCPQGQQWQNSSTTWYTNGTYNEVASLLFGTLENAVKYLFSRDTHLEFNYPALFSVLPFYFLSICWACGTAVACGALVPMLIVGAIYGRIVGRIMVSMFGIYAQRSYWEWMDPGAFALIGAASFFGGVTRLTLAVTVIMMELTNDVQVLLPVMASVLISKWVGDFFTHPVYHALLELKCIPFLDPEPRVTIDKHIYDNADSDVINLELYAAKDIMSHPVITIQTKELVQVLSNLLVNTTHGGFPVILKGVDDEEHFFGVITRLELTVILMHEELFVPSSELSDDSDSIESEHDWIDFEMVNIVKIKNPEELTDTLHRYIEDSKYRDLAIDLCSKSSERSRETGKHSVAAHHTAPLGAVWVCTQTFLRPRPYINQSALCIAEKFSLQRTYIIFRTLGLRHLTVVNSRNIVKGIITRKDLMGFSMQEKLSNKVAMDMQLQTNGRVEMNDVVRISEPV